MAAPVMGEGIKGQGGLGSCKISSLNRTSREYWESRGTWHEIWSSKGSPVLRATSCFQVETAKLMLAAPCGRCPVHKFADLGLKKG